MFVPEFTKDGKEYKCTFWDSKHNVAFFEYSDGSNTVSSCSSTKMIGEPIMIQCPHCNTSIQQQERVSCECGWCAEAISEEQYQQWRSVSDCRYTREPKHAFITTKTSLCGSPTRLEFKYIYHINNIHWLQIREGKNEN